ASAPPDLMFWGGDPEEDAFELGVVLLKPHSRGSVRLRSADPEAPPVIELPALTDPSDHARLVEGYRLALELVHHSEVAAPDVPSGFTHFPTIMIAERLAERLAGSQ